MDPMAASGTLSAPGLHSLTHFFWMSLVLMGLSCRAENLGVTSFVRVLHLRPEAYHRLLHLFHSKALNLDILTACWVRLCVVLFRAFEVDSRLVCIAEGIKAPKEDHSACPLSNYCTRSRKTTPSRPSPDSGRSVATVHRRQKAALGGLCNWQTISGYLLLLVFNASGGKG